MPINNEELLRQLKTFFGQEKYQENDIHRGIEDGDIIIDNSLIANKFKGTLHDESIIEVELNHLTRVFFCRVLDHPPEVEESTSEENLEEQKPVYGKGTYLDNFDHIIITPLEPSIGNFLICPAPDITTRVLLRIIASRQAYEFGCYFDAKVHVNGMPVLKVTFPVVARTLSNAREFRAKIPTSMQFDVLVEMKERRKTFTTQPLDISPNGMFLVDPMGRDTDLKANEPVYLEMKVEGHKSVTIEASIRHMTRLRNAKGIQYCFGVQFDLATRAIASSIEGLVALVQRKHLRELSEIAEQFGVNYENW